MSQVREVEVLPQAEWQQSARAHRTRAEAWTQPYRSRRAAGKMHPVYDFLFIYYRFAPALLERWHPGYGVCLEGARLGDTFSQKQYSESHGAVYLDASKIEPKLEKRLRWSLGIARAAESRPPLFGCFGMHEWAMVYRGGLEGRPRHEGTLPLRLSQAETDRVVESKPICCSHFDAFRFFTESALPYNKLQPSQDTRIEHEQTGCLHTNMDLYKWTAKCSPWLGSDLLWDTFRFAVQCREIDMRASPYDCRELGYEPIKIETATGRDVYEAAQRALTEQAKPLRKRLIEGLELVLEAI